MFQIGVSTDVGLDSLLVERKSTALMCKKLPARSLSQGQINRA